MSPKPCKPCDHLPKRNVFDAALRFFANFLHSLRSCVCSFFFFYIHCGRSHQQVSMHGRCNKHSFSKFSGQSKYCVADMPSCRLIQQEILSFSSRNVYLLFTHHIVEYICIHSGSIDDHLCFIHRILCADPISACNPSLNLFHFLIQTKLHAILRRIFCKCDR